MQINYRYATKEIETLVRQAEWDWFDVNEFVEKIEPHRRALLQRAAGFTYSEQLVGGYITECVRYVRAGMFRAECRQPMLQALARLHAAASFEAKP